LSFLKTFLVTVKIYLSNISKQLGSITMYIPTIFFKKKHKRGGGGRKSLKVLKVEIKVVFSVFLAIFLSKLCLKLIASEEKIEKKIAFWA